MQRLIIALSLICFMTVTGVVQADMSDRSTAVLRGLDKVSARTQTFETGLNNTLKFGKNLFIRVRACRKSAPIDPPESAAFIEVWEKDAETKESHWIFSGWMFASSPALSAMDHAVYDVWLIDCKNDSTPKKSAPKDTAPVDEDDVVEEFDED